MHYLDNAATTPVCPEAVAAATKAMECGWGNPSSTYTFGRNAAKDRDADRATLSKALGCKPDELFFTSCGSESDNWAIWGAVELNKRKGKHIITTAIEHSAVLEPIRRLERQGYEVTYLSPNAQGTVSIEDLKNALRDDTILVSMMLVNNELGTVLPVAETAKAIKAKGCPALLHCDAVQAFLKIPFTPAELGVDLLSISGHKIMAPKGIGALYVKKGVRLPAMMLGGGQESGQRPGTEATAQIAAFAAAAGLYLKNAEAYRSHMAEIKQYTISRLRESLDEVVILCEGAAPHILPISLPGYKSEPMVRLLGDMDIYVSSGSACHKGKPSHVFASMKLKKPVLDGVLRISFSPATTKEDIEALIEGLKKIETSMFKTLS